MGILSGETFLDQVVQGNDAQRASHPRPDGLESRGFATDKDSDGWDGLYAVGQTPDGAWWRVNHLSGAFYRMYESPKRVFAPGDVTRCIMHNFHLISHIPPACRSQAWESADGRILSYADKIDEGYQHRRSMAFRAVADASGAVRLLDGTRRSSKWNEEPFALQIAQIRADKARREASAQLERLRNFPQSDALGMIEIDPMEAEEKDWVGLAKLILGDGIPKNPNHESWEWPGSYPGPAVITGYCPDCGEEALRLNLSEVEINGYRHGEQFRRFRQRRTRLEVIESAIARRWMPNEVEHVRSYTWIGKYGSPEYSGEQIPENASSWFEYDVLPNDVRFDIGKRWKPSETPPRCQYCEWIRSQNAMNIWL